MLGAGMQIYVYLRLTARGPFRWPEALVVIDSPAGSLYNIPILVCTNSDITSAGVTLVQLSNPTPRDGSETTISQTVCLADLPVGQRATVLALTGGHGFLGRMAALGFTPGAEVAVIRNSGHGPLIVSVLDTFIALGRGQAQHVHVRPADGGSS